MATRQNQLLSKLPLISKAQCRWLVLKFCAEATCNHILRNVPLPLCRPIANWHDTALWHSLLALFDINPALAGDAPWYIASLPMHLGGLGLRSSARLAAAIHWAAWADIFQNLHKSRRVHKSCKIYPLLHRSQL